jgi:hypothetical protein
MTPVPTEVVQPEVQPAWRITRADVVTAATPLPRRAARGKRARTAVLVGLLAFVAVQVGFHQVIDREVVPLRDPIWAEKLGLLKQHPEFWDSSPPPLRGRSSTPQEWAGGGVDPPTNHTLPLGYG